MVVLEGISHPSLAIAGIGLTIYLLTGAIYRLYFHPLRHVPGPRLAALTLWYEFYYDIVLRGQYIFKIRQLHEEYGPIIRINPYEVHVSSPQFYDELYSGGYRKRDKWYWSTKALGADDSTFATTSHDLHRLRRAALNPFFSKAQVRKLQPLIVERVDAMLDRLREYKESGDVISLKLAFAAFTADVVLKYAFGRSERKLNAIDFDASFHDACLNGGKSSALMKQFPWILRCMKATPTRLLLKLNPSMTSFVRMHKDIAVQIKETIAKPRADRTTALHPTVFQEILDSKLPDEEKTISRLAQDGGTVVGAGTVTTAWALSVATFYLVSQPTTLEKLKTELQSAIPDPFAKALDLVTIERLPYLSAIIQESLRLSYGLVSRQPRISPDEVITYVDPATGQEWRIPPGTPVSMTSLLVLQDPTLFPNPEQFRPERWIENPRLDRYQVAFNKGTRICLGINLAYAELYLMLAGIFRSYGSVAFSLPGDVGRLELFETDVSDVACVRDGLVPLPKADSKGVRFRVRA